ncbi:MAG TPA: DNA helicase UvrD, partial [Candidatus Omnitrophica bacterium]|nr:DNA helicase UvrD [Candidatus Omnitrophota bacterium]
MDIEHLAHWADLKGIKLLGTGDFTHPEWLEELKDKLHYEGMGIYKFRNTYFLLTGEVCNIFPDMKSGKIKKIHHIILSPDFSEVERINEELKRWGDLS